MEDRDTKRRIEEAVMGERKAVVALLIEAGNKCAASSQGCGCYLTFTRLAQIIQASK